MKTTEQLCVKCGEFIDSGATWIEENKCPGCGAEIAQYQEGKTYRWYQFDNNENAQKQGRALLSKQARDFGIPFVGRNDKGYWLYGPIG